MRQVRCIKERVGVPVGTVVEVGDDAEVSDLYYEPVEPAPPKPATPAPAAPAAAKEVTS